jgi:hypothetical protein
MLTASKAEVKKGDLQGHPFHGNQWTTGISSGSEDKTRAVIAAITENGRISDFNWKDGPGKTAADCKQEVAEKISKRMSEKYGDKFDKRLGTLASFPKLSGRNIKYSAHMSADDVYRLQEGKIAYVGKGVSPEQAKADGLVREDSVLLAGNDPRVAAAAREAGVGTLVGRWAQASNGGITQEALQKAAKDEFGLHDALGGSTNVMDNRGVLREDADYAKNGEMYRAVLRSQYDETQDFFRKAGVSEIPVWRGVRWSPVYAGKDVPNWAKEDGTATIPMKPMSSFSYQPNIAVGFANDSPSQNGMNNALISATVPVSSVLSCARTGFGCLGEKEIVVLGGTLPFAVDANIGIYQSPEVIKPKSTGQNNE